MKRPPSDSSAFEWNRNISGSAAYSVEEQVTTRGATYVPLDDFLQVEVLDQERIRTAVKTFLTEHPVKAGKLSLLAARGKLIADLGSLGKQRLSFGEMVKCAEAALQKSDSEAFRRMDARELARVLCSPALGT